MRKITLKKGGQALLHMEKMSMCQQMQEEPAVLREGGRSHGHHRDAGAVLSLVLPLLRHPLCFVK